MDEKQAVFEQLTLSDFIKMEYHSIEGALSSLSYFWQLKAL